MLEKLGVAPACVAHVAATKYEVSKDKLVITATKCAREYLHWKLCIESKLFLSI